MAEQQGQPEKKPRKQRRRGRGEGTIYKRKDRDGYAASITLENRKRKTVYGKTHEQVQAKLLKLRYEQKQGTLITNRDQKVGPYLEWWLEHVQKPSVRLITYSDHVMIVRKHLVPALGHRLLRKLSPDHIQTLYTQKREEGKRPRSIIHIHGILHEALQDAVRRNKLARNPADAVTLPRLDESEAQALTVEQARQVLEAARGHRLEVLLVVAVVMGLRRGELIGLQWRDIDLEKGLLQVCRTVVRVPGHGLVVSEPKTASGRRTIKLPAFVIDVLKRHRTEQAEKRLAAGPAWHEQGIVFCNTKGGFFEPAHVQKLLQRLLERAGLVHIRLHDLRHSAATILLSLGVPAHVVKEILGHSDVRITLGIYGHVLPRMHSDAMDIMGDLFGGDDSPRLGPGRMS